jgi:hypothetical protein
MDTNIIIAVVVIAILFYFYTNNKATDTTSPSDKTSSPSGNTSSPDEDVAVEDVVGEEEDYEWGIYKGNSSYVVARLNKTPKTGLYECVATDGKNCFWKGSYDGALNDLNNLPSSIKPVSGDWLDLVKVTSPPEPEPWKVCKTSSTGDYTVVRNDTGSFGKASECATSDGKNCFWRKDKNAVNDYFNNLSPSTSIPLKGYWGDFLDC